MILIGLGGNLPSRVGPVAVTLRRALADLDKEGVRVKALSRFWHTAPVPASEQPWFINAAAEVETPFGPHELLYIFKRIEGKYGRKQAAPNASRVLDLDLVAYNDQVSFSEACRLPHPRLRERGFVLLPLRDIAPDWQNPATGERLEDMIASLPDQQLYPMSEEQAV